MDYTGLSEVEIFVLELRAGVKQAIFAFTVEALSTILSTVTSSHLKKFRSCSSVRTKTASSSAIM